MKLHEYQAKQLFAEASIPVPRGIVARTSNDAASAYETLKQRCARPGDGERRAGGASATFACNVKAQLHAGGRGKAGGILVATSAREATAIFFCENVAAKVCFLQ